MSNPNVGSIYHQIIRDVIDTSRVDFEEGGVDESVLDELARVSFDLSYVQVDEVEQHAHQLYSRRISDRSYSFLVSLSS